MKGAHLYCLIGFVSLGAATDAAAGAFAIREGSAAAQGASFAGRTSGDRDVSFTLTNPAALRGVESFEATAGLSGIFASADATADRTVGPFSRTDNPSEQALVPSFAAGYRWNERLVLGLAVDAPFGLETRYDDDFIGSFDAVESSLVTISVTPMASFQVMPGLDVAAGVTVQYADAKLSNRTGLGEVSDVEGDDFGFGFTLGALWDPLPGTTVGAAFQYGISHEIDGELSDNYVVPVPGVGAVNVGGAATANLDLPWVATVGVTQRITDDLRLMGEVEYTNWSIFEDITIDPDAAPFDLVEEQNYDDSWFLAFGAEYDVTDAFTVRGGVAWDQTPVQDGDRTPRVPDGDRVWFSAGFSYAITPTVAVDAAYSYISFEDVSATLERGAALGIPGTVVDYDSDAHVVGLNLRYRF